MNQEIKLNPRKEQRPWTPEEELILAQEWARGASAWDIGQKLGRSTPSIWDRTSQLKLAPISVKEKITDPTFGENLRSLYASKAPVAQIMKDLDLTTASLYAALKFHNIPMRNKPGCGLSKGSRKSRRKYDDAFIENLKIMVNGGECLDVISARLGLSYSKVQALIFRYKLRESKDWTVEDERTMIEMLRQGQHPSKICVSIQRTPYSINWKLSQLKITKDYPQVARYIRDLENARTETLDSILRVRLASCKHRKFKDFDLTLEYLKNLYAKQNGKCHYSGVQLTFVSNDPHVLSVDRVDSDLGYIEGNVVLCAWVVNAMKSDLGREKFVEMCSMVAATERSRQNQQAAAAHLPLVSEPSHKAA